MASMQQYQSIENHGDKDRVYKKQAAAPKKDNIVVSVKDLHKSFDDNHVIRGVDLELHEGENIVVMGRSASGKSVLIKIIIGLMQPNKGSRQAYCRRIDY